MRACVCVCVCVTEWGCVCLRARVCACVHACVRKGVCLPSVGIHCLASRDFNYCICGHCYCRSLLKVSQREIIFILNFVVPMMCSILIFLSEVPT